VPDKRVIGQVESLIGTCPITALIRTYVGRMQVNRRNGSPDAQVDRFHHSRKRAAAPLIASALPDMWNL